MYYLQARNCVGEQLHVKFFHKFSAVYLLQIDYSEEKSQNKFDKKVFVI